MTASQPSASRKTASYGSWVSPITSDAIVADSIDLVDALLDGATAYWIERRPKEGRDVLVRKGAGAEPDDTVLPKDFNARTSVHTYGGGAVAIQDGVVYASNFRDQRLYRCVSGSAPVALTPEPAAPGAFGPNLRYADGRIPAGRNLWIGIREDHVSKPGKVINTIVAIDTAKGGAGNILVEGADFYSSPRLSADGKRLAWLSWNHPDMPWTATELWIGDLTDSGVVNRVKVAGGESESVFQPEWVESSALYFVSDRTDWWNLYRWQNGQTTELCNMAAEFGKPQWAFGMSTYAVVDDTRLVCSYSSTGLGRLAVLDVARRELVPLDVPDTEFAAVRARGDQALYLGGAATAALAAISFDVSARTRTVLRESATIDAGVKPYLTEPEAVEFPTADGKTAHGLYYAPRNPDYSAPQGEKPPLLVKCHGGPTAAASSTLNLSTQFWTSRGIAVLDVNYGGSTGFGRSYRDRLHRSWGIVDVDDCVNGARYLADKGLADGKRAVMTGGSAGGYTTLAALAFRKFFRAGASLYGIGDLAALARDTHKFESHYMDWLVARYPDEEALYRERSPLFHVGDFDAPVIFFQGSEDTVVPQAQTETMVEALRAKGVPVGYLLFVGEGHGFKDAENRKRALDAQLYFFDTMVFRAGLAFEIRKNPA